MSTPVHWEVARGRQDEMRLAKAPRRSRRMLWRSPWKRAR